MGSGPGGPVRLVVVAGLLAGAAMALAQISRPVPLRAAGENAEMRDNFFVPDPIIVTVGDAVTWTNVGFDGHTTTNGVRGDAGAGNAWDHLVLPSGSSPSVVFGTVGTVPYFCRIHPGMDGIIVVEAPPTPTPTATATPTPRPTPTATAVPPPPPPVPTATATATATPKPPPAPTASPTATPAPTATPTIGATPTSREPTSPPTPEPRLPDTGDARLPPSAVLLLAVAGAGLVLGGGLLARRKRQTPS